MVVFVFGKFLIFIVIMKGFREERPSEESLRKKMWYVVERTDRVMFHAVVSEELYA